ncbi:MAG: prolyl oligopeptidase family serine peptidase, partial [Anaerolineae bacterium]|nr:prolyl oligopeptidase family serine peptidase [Anaerolineae bacterium]
MNKNFTYPDAAKGDVVDDFHGMKVADPYRWMEDTNTPEVRAYIDAQNELTQAFMSEISITAQLRERLTALWNFTRHFSVEHRGSRYFLYVNDGLQNQPVLYMQESLDSEPVPVLDPNTFSDDGTVALTSMAINDDGSAIAYGISSGGSDQQEIHIRNLASGEDYREVLQWCRFSGIAWKSDGSGFFYNRGPEPTDGNVHETYLNNMLYWHQLGTSQSEDVLVYKRPDMPELNFPPQLSDDGRYVVLYVFDSAGGPNRLYYRPVEREGDFVRLVDEADAHYEFLGSSGKTLFIRTDLDAPRWRVIAVDVDHPQREHWREVIPQQEDVLDQVVMVHKHFAVAYMHDAHHRLCLYDLDGNFARELELPTIGSITGLFAHAGDDELFFGFQSYLYPPTIFRYDFATGQITVFRDAGLDLNIEDYETRQVFATSKDGTRIPMFITHKKGLQLNGENPTLMYGYGGFNISLTPTFNVADFVWLEAGGVYVVVNLRGGGEYGEEWHRAGMLENKQNVFDDFISAGEWLIDNGYTSSKRLGIYGGSNGGLLVAACMLQRPDLFGAVICGVPVADM